MRLAGVDGCPGGWVAAVADCSAGVWTWAGWHVDVAGADLPALGDAVLVDMPMGLPETGRRPLEREVRRRLSPRGSCVFPTPVRSVLQASSYEEACALSRRDCDGLAISRQTWLIVDKIRDVDGVPGLVEAHPELTLATIAGAVLPPKKTAAGREQRISLLTGVYGWPVADLVARGRRLGSARADDLLDAMALLWSARRWAAGEAEVFDDGVDGLGRPMRIVV